MAGRDPTLPVEEALPALLTALRTQGQAVLQAPPGAGKTTRVPLAMLEDGTTDGTILMLEPRRLATRGAAERMASMLGEKVGQTVGFRMRGASQVSRATRIEVVTEGILTRRLQSDPELAGVGAVIFDEFHERSLNADFGLALCLEVRAALREDLKLLVMSATLDAAPVAALMGDAPVITSEGRSYPVEVVYLPKPRHKDARLERDMADLIGQALREQTGSVLAFLPGEGEIRRVERALQGAVPGDVAIRPLYGALPFAAQQEAIQPTKSGRKVVLATSIAETSLTIQGIGAVVDAGLSRRARFDPGSGMSQLVTEKVTRAEAEQRAGRAGRLGPGRAYRLWTRGEQGALAAFPPAEIEAADLTGLAVELAQWGAEDLPFLTAPPAGALAEAKELLTNLGVLDAGHSITAHGRKVAALPVHPRLGHMLLRAGAGAAPLAALLSDRDPLRGASCDLGLRLTAIKGGRVSAEVNRAGLDRIRAEAKRLAKMAPADRGMSDAAAAALAYPDRIGMRRTGDAPRWLLSGGKGAVMTEGDPLVGSRLIVALDLDGDARAARMRMAVPIREGELREIYADQIAWADSAAWSKRDRRVLARRQEKLGAIVLADQQWRDAPDDVMADAALDGVRDLGLSWSAKSRLLQARVQFYGDGLADVTDATLEADITDWLLPYLGGRTTAEALKSLDLTEPLKARIGWDGMARLDQSVPARFTTPTGRTVAIDYSGEHPEIALRLQELFGVTVHPVVGPARLPLRVTLLSPAQRPIQTTMDLPGFWAGSYADVRKDMRAQYPRHPWPEDPTVEEPTLRAKRRKT
jgi:ATP-dependent helicase HrpB